MDDIYNRFRKPSNGGSLPPSQPSRPVIPPQRTPVQTFRGGVTPNNYVPTQVPNKKKSKTKRKGAIAIVLVLLIALGGMGSALYIRDRNIDRRLEQTGPLAPPEQPRSQNQTAGTIRLVATGDMIAHESINQNAKKADGSYDYAALMDKTKPYFKKADIRFCNQSTPAGGEQFGISGYPVFNAPIEFARGLEAVGCNLINIGTNHTNDKGQALVDATVTAWDDRQGVLAVAGANRSLEERNKSRVFETKGMKFAFLSYSTYTNKPVTNGFAVNMYDEAKAKAEIAAAQVAADFVIVSMRWGTEYSADVNASQDQVAKVVADAGADVILGHGPHDMQPVKRLKTADGREVPVWFSLGNFLNSQIDIQNLIGGFAVMDIDVASKKIANISFLPVYQHYEWTPEQAARHNNADLAARHNFQMIPLDQATDLLAMSQNKTTVPTQTERVKQLLNKFTEVPIITSAQY